jgi:alkanesulfonate monooxygenase SsuD/methylene tetrahydromethanopterin reductase-like flavin-dependent oxidoreductase (luciferase family)
VIPTPTTSVLYPLQAVDLGQVTAFARILQRRGDGRLWLGQSLGIETHQVFAALAGAGVHVPFGSSVTLAPLRHPYDAAVQARSVARLSGLPYVAGIGPGAPDFQTMVRPRPYERPVAATREYLTTMRALLRGGQVDDDAPEHSTHTSLPPMDAPAVELGLGVLRPSMARAAGAAADVGITWMTPPAYVSGTIVPEVAKGAAGAGRPAPRLAAVVHVAVERPGRDVVAIAHRGAGSHLAADHYTDMLRRAGVPADPADPRRGAELLVASGTFVAGTARHIAAELDRYRDHGVNEVILNLCGVLGVHGLGAAITDLTEILDAVDGRRG